MVRPEFLAKIVEYIVTAEAPSVETYIPSSFNEKSKFGIIVHVLGRSRYFGFHMNLIEAMTVKIDADVKMQKTEDRLNFPFLSRK